jgi:hypothetical protein
VRREKRIDSTTHEPFLIMGWNKDKQAMLDSQCGPCFLFSRKETRDEHEQATDAWKYQEGQEE